MIVQGANKITSLLLHEDIIRKEDKEIYQYGLELILSTCLNFILVILIAWVMGRIEVGVFYILTLASLRPYAGGFHASSYFRCGMLYCAMFVASVVGVELLCCAAINFVVTMLVLLINIIFIRRHAPVLHHNRMSEEEMRAAGKKAGRRCLIWLMLAAVFYRQYRICSYAICLSVTIISLFMFIGRKMEEREK